MFFAFFHPKRLFSRYLLSYLFIIVISLLISILAYNASVQVIQSEITKGHNSSLGQVKNTIDSRLAKLTDVYVQIGFDGKLQLLMSRTEPLEPAELLDLAKKRDDLLRYKLTSPYIKEIYIYFNRNSFVLMNSGRHELDTFYSSVFMYGNENFNSWIKGEDAELVTFTYNVGEETETGIAYVRQLPYARTQNALGKLVIIIDDEAITHTMDQMQWIPEAGLFLVDTEGRIVVGNNSANVVSYLPDESLDEQAIAALQDHWIISRIRSDFYDWTYLSVIPRSVFFARANLVKNIILLSLSAFFILGLAASYLLAKRNYTPMDKLVRYIQDNVKESAHRDEDQDEYNFVRSIVENIIDEKRKYQEKESRQREKLINDFYIGLIGGELDTKAIDEMKGIYNIRLDESDQYITVLLYVDESHLFPLSGELGKETDNLPDISRLIIDNVLGKLIEERCKYTAIQTDDAVVSLISTGKGDPAMLLNDIRSIMSRAEEIIRNRFNVGFCASAGNIHAGYEGIVRSYREAGEAMEYRELIGAAGTQFYQDIRHENMQTDHFYFKKDMERFRQYILSGNMRNAKSIVHSIFQERLQGGARPMPLIKLRMNEIILAFLDATTSLQISGGAPELYMHIVNHLSRCRTIDSLQSEIDVMLEDFERRLSCSEQAEKALHQRVVSYINDHYQQNDLNISAIADAFSVSVPYLSKQFKKKMGVGSLEYLQLIRIEKAKLLMKNSPDCIKDIANEVGFFNSISFIRVFKKYEGVTPGVYKEINRKR